METIQWPANVTWKSLTDGHERSLLRNIHTELDKTTDRVSTGMIRQVLEAADTWCASQLELSSSIEQYWEDEFAINGTIFPEDYTPKRGLWTNDEFKGNLRISHVLERSGPI
ncbi:hypothetical protein BDW75DRAFT_246581 [Aspergillus navahoensis]